MKYTPWRVCYAINYNSESQDLAHWLLAISSIYKQSYAPNEAIYEQIKLIFSLHQTPIAMSMQQHQQTFIISFPFVCMSLFHFAIWAVSVDGKLDFVCKACAQVTNIHMIERKNLLASSNNYQVNHAYFLEIFPFRLVLCVVGFLYVFFLF